MRNSLHNPGHWGSSLSFCPSLLAPSRIFETNSHTSKNKTRFKYSHAKCSWPTQFWSHNRFKGCTVVPYHRPALHPCLPLHLPALLCLQALCPAHPPHHPPHTELEYIQILRKKRKENKHYTVKKFYIELYQPFILEMFINYCQNKKSWRVTWRDIYGEVTLPDSNESRNACPWGVSKAVAVKAARAFLSNRCCEKLNKKGTGRTSNQNKGYCSPRKILVFSLPHQNSYHHWIACVY